MKSKTATATKPQPSATKGKRLARTVGGTQRQDETCFVLSPFGGWFDTYYDSVFEPAITKAGLLACRADDLYRPSSIVHDIWSYVRKAKVLLADLTGKNPNVLYELGLAHAIGKPVVMVTQSLDDVPFDLRNLRVITYDLRDPAWGEDLGRRIAVALEEVLSAPELAVPPAFLKERKEAESPQVSPLEKRVLELSQQVESLRRSQRVNPSDRDILPADEALALVERYLRLRMPDRMILDRLVRRGVPANWIESQLKRLKRAVEEVPVSPEVPDSDPVTIDA